MHDLFASPSAKWDVFRGNKYVVEQNPLISYIWQYTNYTIKYLVENVNKYYNMDT